MAIAISDFEALCGFITAPELAEVLLTYPEIHPCIGASSIESAVGSSGLGAAEGRAQADFHVPHDL